MKIKDSFIYNNHTALYIDTNHEDVPQKISCAKIKNKEYKVLMYDKLISIIGNVAIVVLIDTDDSFEFEEEIVLE